MSSLNPPPLLSLMALILLTGCGAEPPEAAPPSAGQLIYKENCKVCHAQGINGAPILGNKKMWRNRSGQELGVLVSHAEQGFGLMPAKGGNQDLTPKELEQAIVFMLSALEN